MSLSIIIPSKNAHNLAACIGAIRAMGETSRIIVIDDGLQWDSQVDLDRLRFIPQTVHFVAGVKPFIFSQAVNIGIAAAGDDDVVLLNDDALLESPGGFTLLQQAASDNPEYAIVGAVTDFTGQPLQRPMGKGLRHVEHIAFVCVYIPRTTITRLGGLDERYCLDYGVEDRDYCETVNRAGLKVGVHDGCFVNHSKLKSTFRGDPSKSIGFQRNQQLFNEKWGIHRNPPWSRG
jgi:GT2 family glycosyltransferase